MFKIHANMKKIVIFAKNIMENVAIFFDRLKIYQVGYRFRLFSGLPGLPHVNSKGTFSGFLELL